MSLELSVCAACVRLWGEPVEVRLGARCSSSSSEAVVAGLISGKGQNPGIVLSCKVRRHRESLALLASTPPTPSCYSARNHHTFCTRHIRFARLSSSFSDPLESLGFRHRTFARCRRCCLPHIAHSLRCCFLTSQIRRNVTSSASLAPF